MNIISFLTSTAKTGMEDLMDNATENQILFRLAVLKRR
jgi:hypothetical protein